MLTDLPIELSADAECYLASVVLFRRGYNWNSSHIKNIYATCRHVYGPDRLELPARAGGRGFIISLHEPTRAAIEYIAVHCAAIATRVDLAIDFPCHSRPDAFALQTWLSHRLVIHQRPRMMKTVETTAYLGTTARPGQSIALYADKPARTLEDGRPCAHLELRVKGKQALKRHGLYLCKPLLDFDHRDFWHRALNRWLYLAPDATRLGTHEVETRRRHADKRIGHAFLYGGRAQHIERVGERIARSTSDDTGIISNDLRAYMLNHVYMHHGAGRLLTPLELDLMGMNDTDNKRD